jgi:glycosyltransferase involved in cell wall biosynthesis
MNLVIFQCLDRAGGGSRASLSGTLSAVRDGRPDWNLKLVTRESGPLSRMAEKRNITHHLARFPRFRKAWEKPWFWWDCRKLAESIAGFSPDGILSNEWVTAPHALAAARHLGIPAMSYVRDFVALKRGRKYQLHRMDRLLCVCESMRRGLISAGYDPSRIFTVYNPVLRPVSREPAPEVRARISGQTGVDRWLLYLGRISPRKNQIAAVETLRRLREISGQRWGMLLAGDADEAYAAELDRFVLSAGLQDAVLRLGVVAEPGWLFELSEASIMTSKSEGLARVLIESFLCGKPAFSHPLEGIEDVYGNELAAFVSRESDPGDLAEKILTALADGPQLRARTEKLAGEFEERHSIRHHVEAFERAVRCE